MFARNFQLGGRLATTAAASNARRSLSMACTEGNSAKIHVRRYSMSGKKAPLVPEQASTESSTTGETQQPQKTPGIKLTSSSSTSRSKVPKFTMPQSEFMTAAFFAQNRQVVQVPEADAAGQQVKTQWIVGQPRPSFKTLSELALCLGQSAKEAQIPCEPLRQVYAAPASVYMRVATPVSMIPEAMRLGPMAEALFGQDTFSGGLSTMLKLEDMDAEDIAQVAEDAFNAMVVSRPDSEDAERVQRTSRWMLAMDNRAEEYQMTSVKRKRKAKMNKHKQKKLRKRLRAVRKRQGKI
ncbi:hypothetical protein GGI07_004711 [Coemansia sp. Benny D115]|nr:hypothetical protein GGI07_004711 [Coemansia sp. Benny D115]